MTQIQILINIQFNNDVIFKYLWIYVLYNNYANSSEPSFYEGAHQRGCPKQMGRWTSLHQVEGSVLLLIRLRANTSQKNHHFFLQFFRSNSSSFMQFKAPGYGRGPPPSSWVEPIHPPVLLLPQGCWQAITVWWINHLPGWSLGHYRTRKCLSNLSCAR